MRKSTHAAFVVVTSLLASLGLCVASAFAAALAFGAVALIVPGTGTHNIVGPDAVTGYKENAADRYINPSGVPCTSTDGCDLEGIPYPATFFPLVIFSGWCPGLTCDTWNESVEDGVTNLDAAVNQTLDSAPPDEDIIIFGYSQGGAVVSREMYNLAGLNQETKDRISVVTIGNINNPQGLWSRLGFLPTIPFIDLTFGPQLPTDIGIKSTNYSFEYDPVGDAPLYWGNPLAVLNALAAFEYVHGYYLDPNSNGPYDTMPYGYTDETLAAAIDAAPKRQYQDATFVLIPQQGTLPLFTPFQDLGQSTGTSFLVDPIIKLVQPLTKLLIDLGYDRAINPGIPQTLLPLPFNPFALGPDFPVKVIDAIEQGVRDAFGPQQPTLTPAPPSTEQQAAAAEARSRLVSTSQPPRPAPEAAEQASDTGSEAAAEDAPLGGVVRVARPDNADLAASRALAAAEDEAATQDRAETGTRGRAASAGDDSAAQQDDSADTGASGVSAKPAA
ncbi:PE-PPE domain-containing protein [Mycolicibacterium sp. F2034L]|uniref:PE-PPE domain-containing protein n=1 Tax=Mycolicibacterium sp. F2034L TaxID=2926422 RepID=UPI001FF2E1A4|nr:PE-PPE domain-containing protein [Mycolicibacterium sp. F2034L]MCK0173767.1 PE-PPE domain-containing protein [Mycolicibacterium sp. F2034L]